MSYIPTPEKLKALDYHATATYPNGTVRWLHMETGNILVVRTDGVVRLYAPHIGGTDVRVRLPSEQFLDELLTALVDW